MTDRPPSPFQLARDQLRAIGVQLDMLPGEYRVNLRGAGPETAYFTADLADAIEHGRSIAPSRPAGEAAPAPATGKPVRYRRRRKMTPKAFNRRLRKQHMRRLRAKAIKEQQKDA